MHQVKISTPEYPSGGKLELKFCYLLICLIYIWFYHFELGRCKVIVYMYNDVETRGSSTAAGRHYGGFITRCILSIPYNMHVVVTINVYLYMYSLKTLLQYTPINHWQASCQNVFSYEGMRMEQYLLRILTVRWEVQRVVSCNPVIYSWYWWLKCYNSVQSQAW